MAWFAEPETFDESVLAALVEEETGGEPHASVWPAGAWLDEAERARARQRLADARARYAHRGRDIDDPDWWEIASTLASPREARFGYVSFPQHDVHYSVLAAADSWFGLIAGTEGSEVHVRTFRKERLADAVVAGLAEFVWHCGEAPIRVTHKLLHAAETGVAGLREPHTQLVRLQRLMALPVYLSCEFYAEYQPGHHQTRRRSETPLRVYGLGDETFDAGCWTLSTTRDGVLLAPADLDDLATRIEQLRRDLED